MMSSASSLSQVRGGIGYLLEHHYGINLPKKMREEFGNRVKSISEQQSRERSVEELQSDFQRYLFESVCAHLPGGDFLFCPQG